MTCGPTAGGFTDFRVTDNTSGRTNQQIATGNANKIIADKLTISEDTVTAHMESILSELGANNRTHAVTTAMRRGFLDPT